MKDLIYKAIAVSISPQATTQERRDSFQYLQPQNNELLNLWSLIQEWLTISHYYQQTDITLHVHLWCLQLLIRVVKTVYSNMAEAERHQVQNFIFQQCQRTMPRTLARQWSVVLEQVVLRSFPQDMPNAKEQLIALPSTVLWPGLACILSDVTDAQYNTSVPTRRRTDIVAGLVELPIVPDLYRQLETSYGVVLQANNESALDICRDGLALVQSIFASMPVSWGTTLVDAVIAMSSHEELVQPCVAALLPYASRKGVDMWKLVEQLPTQLSRILPQMDEDVWQSTAQCIATISQHAQVHFTTSNDSQEQYRPILYRFWQFQIHMLQQAPNPVVVATEQISAWTTLWRDPVVREQHEEMLQPILPDLFRCYLGALARKDDGEETNLSELRSHGSSLFGLWGQCAPEISAGLLLEAFQKAFQTTTENATMESTFPLEGLVIPLDNVLDGIPKQLLQSANNTTSSLTSLVQLILQWQPTNSWNQFRCAQLLESCRYYWAKSAHTETLFPTIQLLLSYMESQRAIEIGLPKKAGVALVAIVKLVNQLLVPYLPQLSTRIAQVLPQLPPNQVHLYEVITCLANALPDVGQRRNFIQEQVLQASLQLIQDCRITSPAGILELLGVDQPERAQEEAFVAERTQAYTQLFAVLNRALAVGKRCHEATRQHDNTIHSLEELSQSDPFVPAWPRILPTVLGVLDGMLGLWHVQHYSVLIQHPIQCYLYAISEDEAYLCQKQTHGGVFGPEGMGGRIVQGFSRKNTHLAPKWSGWTNELRNTCFQLMGLVCTSQALYAPEMQSFLPRVIQVLTSHLMSMEHRHLQQYSKHVIELLLVSCPPAAYASCVGPIVGPCLENVQWRLQETWKNMEDTSRRKALARRDCRVVQQLDAQSWYPWYYAHACVFVGDLDDDGAAEAIVEKYRTEIGRSLSDVLQVTLALKGDWALVLANQAKKVSRGGKVSAKPQLNANGTPRATNQDALDQLKLDRINAICHFLLLENESTANHLVTIVVQSLAYPDEYTCRRMSKVSHRILETVAWSPVYTHLLGNVLFTQAVKNVVTEPKWMVGMEWDLINLVRDVYCRLVLGQALLFGGQGPCVQQPKLPNGQYEQTKTVNQPLQGGGVLVEPSNIPRQILSSIPGVDANMIEQMEGLLRKKRSAKDQKLVWRDLLRVAADNLNQQTENAPSAASGVFDRAVKEESLLHSQITPAIPNLGRKLVTQTQVNKEKARQAKLSEADEQPMYRIF